MNHQQQKYDSFYDLTVDTMLFYMNYMYYIYFAKNSSIDSYENIAFDSC